MIHEYKVWCLLGSNFEIPKQNKLVIFPKKNCDFNIFTQNL